MKDWGDLKTEAEKNREEEALQEGKDEKLIKDIVATILYHIAPGYNTSTSGYYRPLRETAVDIINHYKLDEKENE